MTTPNREPAEGLQGIPGDVRPRQLGKLNRLWVVHQCQRRRPKRLLEIALEGAAKPPCRRVQETPALRLTPICPICGLICVICGR
jgi:hypothetical protein